MLYEGDISDYTNVNIYVYNTAQIQNRKLNHTSSGSGPRPTSIHIFRYPLNGVTYLGDKIKKKIQCKK